MRLAEIGSHIRTQRLALDLTQEQVAKLADLSRTTINQLENGTLKDLGYSKLMNLLGILGLDLNAQPSKGLRHGLVVAARTASTSYRDVLTPEVLARILQTGELPKQFHPHLMVLLDETPLPVVVKAIKEASDASSSSATPKQVMQHMAKWAKQLHAHRSVW